ncbi:RICIN domain-containing protein [Streptomyces sp. NPDC002838]|uniref:RICIN domain-containing protein n=1 Tax=Streptomyces sp. NPDC002838 TaxID=3154436 RepID=UPI0033216D3C
MHGHGRQLPDRPNVDWGPDGRLYVSWGSWTGSGTFMHVLDQSTGKLSTTDHNLWRIAVNIENPTIILTPWSAGPPASRGRTSTRTARTWPSGGGTTVLTGAYPKVAVGGADAYDDGTSKFLAYHYYDGDNSGQETLDIRQVTFANGWPVIAGPLGAANNHLLGNCNSGASTAEGAVAVQSTCTGASHQLWTKTAMTGGYVTFTNVNSGKCLQVAGASTANGAALDQSTCTSGANQQWMIV